MGKKNRNNFIQNQTLRGDGSTTMASIVYLDERDYRNRQREIGITRPYGPPDMEELQSYFRNSDFKGDEEFFVELSEKIDDEYFLDQDLKLAMTPSKALELGQESSLTYSNQGSRSSISGEQSRKHLSPPSSPKFGQMKETFAKIRFDKDTQSDRRE